MMHKVGVSTGIETKGDNLNWAIHYIFKKNSVMENLLLLLVVSFSS